MALLNSKTPGLSKSYWVCIVPAMFNAKTSADALKSTMQTTPVTIRCAIAVISTVPILVVYPFLQRYFVTAWCWAA